MADVRQEQHETEEARQAGRENIPDEQQETRQAEQSVELLKNQVSAIVPICRLRRERSRMGLNQFLFAF